MHPRCPKGRPRHARTPLGLKRLLRSKFGARRSIRTSARARCSKSNVRGVGADLFLLRRDRHCEPPCARAQPFSCLLPTKCWWGATTVARFFRRLPNLDNCLSRAGTRRGSQRSVFEIVVVIERRAGALRLRRRRTLQELRHVAVVRLARFPRRALGRIAADLRLQLYDVEEDVGSQVAG